MPPPEPPLPPADPIAAVRHADPYPFYASLVARRPLYFDENLRLWVASSAEAVAAVLASDLCRVRPPSEPVPRTIAGSAAGDIFGRLVRMTDGDHHCAFKRAVTGTLDGVGPLRLEELAAASARDLGGRLAPMTNRRNLDLFIGSLPVAVVAALLGVPAEHVANVVAWAQAFAVAITPLAEPAEIEAGKEGAQRLVGYFRDLLGEANESCALHVLARYAGAAGRSDAEPIIANGIGFLSQTYEATAALIANTLVALAARPEVRTAVAAEPQLIAGVVDEVARFDPPVQSTRRFVARDGIVAGQTMREGDAILVMLAAAGRDPAVNPKPDRFDIERPDRKVFTFGAGIHGCPGRLIASSIAKAAVEHLLKLDVGLDGLGRGVAYRPSAHVRYPVFS